jgi:uncharacterized protein YcnI
VTLRTAFVLTAGVVLVAAPTALAQVTVNPREVPAGSVARFDIRVPNHHPEAGVVKITVRLPKGLDSVSFQPKPGWERSVTMVKLAEPVTNAEGERVSERIDRVIWKGGTIAPGEFDDFGLSAKVPGKAGMVLAFPALQAYSNGDVVRWLGSPGADQPAPLVTLGAAEDEDARGSEAPATTADDDESGGRATLALVLALNGLAAGLVALVVALRRRPRAA